MGGNPFAKKLINWFMYGNKLKIKMHAESNAIRKLHVDFKFLNENKYIINNY